MAFCDGNRALDSTKPQYLVEYDQNFRLLPQFLFKCWDCFGGVRPTAEQAGVVGGGGEVVDRDKPVACLEP